MKTIIYYFSGTGNSLKTACDLALQLASAFHRRTPRFCLEEALGQTAEFLEPRQVHAHQFHEDHDWEQL